MAQVAGSLEIEIFAGLARLQADMDRANKMVGSATSQIQSAAAKATAALAGIGIGLGVAEFGSMIKGAIDAADKLNDLSKSTDLAVTQLAGLKLAAKQSGTDLDGVASSINKLSVNIGKDAEKFAALGVTAKAPLEAFKQLSDVFKNIEDPQLRAAVGAQALGKSWSSAAPLLMAGSDEIQVMIDKGTKLSGVSQEMADQADAFNDKLEELTGTGGIMNGVTAQLLPLLNILADDLLKIQDKAVSADGGFSALTETFRAVIVFGGNVSFVLKGIGRDLGGLAAGYSAFFSGDFAGTRAIGEMMKADGIAARKEFDTWEATVMGAGKRIKNDYVKDLFGGAASPTKKATDTVGRAFVSGDGAAGKSASEKISEYTRMEEAIAKVNLQATQELANGGKLVASDKFRIEEMQKITFAFATHKISAQERLKLIGFTTQAAAKMYDVEKQAYEQDAIKKNTEALERQQTAIENTVNALVASNEQQRLDNATIGLTTQALDALVLARQDAIIETKQQELATAANNAAGSATVSLLEREVNLLLQKRNLTGTGQKSREGLATTQAAQAFGESVKKPEQLEEEKHKKMLTMLTEYKALEGVETTAANKLLEEEELRHTSAMYQIKTEHEMSMLQAGKGAIDQTYALMVQAGMEQTALGKATFLASKALAIAEIIMNTNVAASKAEAQFGVYGVPIGIAIRAAGYASAGMVAGMAVAQVSGGRANGGGVDAGKMYEVNERGPEMLSIGNRDYLMMGRQGGMVTSNESLKAGVKDGGVTIINQTSAKIGKVTEQRLPNGDRALIVQEAVEAMASQFSDPNSRGSRGISRNFAVQRNR